MKVMITGSRGFLGKNLQSHLLERDNIEMVYFTRAHTLSELPRLLDGVDFVFHLAGVNRPQLLEEFTSGNLDLTVALVNAVESEMRSRGREIPIVYTSSTQATQDNHYGASKRAAEDVLHAFAKRTGAASYVFRLPNVFGKWCRPYYNSVVATFCHNIARDLPIQVNDSPAPLTLVYVDDVMDCFIRLIDGVDVVTDAEGFAIVSPQYTATVGELAHKIESFRASRDSLVTERVGISFTRALYSTFVSYLPPESFAYSVPQYGDMRGVFVEMLKTPDCGQFSFFTANPGITRGGHYHHTKTEKFLVIKGEARFRFRHMQTGDIHELVTRASKAQIVETAPGWTHDITNIGTDEMVVMLWANEVFDRSKPDTYNCPL